MAFRRRRAFRRRGMKRSASAFAPAKSGGGHLDWEASGTTCWSLIQTVFPLANIVYNVQCDGAPVAYQTVGLVLIPLNEARGTVTLLRVRGYLGTENGEVGATTPEELRDGTVHYMLQLVPRDPDLITTPQGSQLLSGNKAPDQESNRIIMQWIAGPGGEYSTFTGEPGGATPNSSLRWFREVDVKTKRRFLRAQWALVLSATATVNALEQVRAFVNLRMLFRADDGI